MHFRYVRLCVKRFWCANRCCFPMTNWSMGSCIWLCWCCCCCHRQWCEMTFNKRHKCGCVCVVSVWLCACGVLIELWWLLPQLLSTLQRTGIRVCVCLCCTPCIVYTRRLCVSPDSFLYFDWLHVLCVCMGVQVVFDCVLHECLSWLCKCHRDIECKCAKIDTVLSMFTFCMVCAWVCSFPLFVSLQRMKNCMGFPAFQSHFVHILNAVLSCDSQECS